jgi:hypothetical protein
MAVSLIFTSCNKSTELTNAIPADASYVIHVNTKSLVEKSKYNVFSNETVKQGINMGKALLKEEDKIKLLENFLKDANSLGLDFKGDCYLYTNYQLYGVVVSVNDAKKLKECILKLASLSEGDIKNEGGIFSVSPQSEQIYAWDSHKLLMLVNIAGYKANEIDLSQKARELLTQGKDKSINTNKTFAEFIKEKKDISVFSTSGGLSNILDSNNSSYPFDADVMGSLKKVLADIDGLSTAMYTSFEDGEIKMNSKAYYDTPETEKKYKELASQMMGTLKGDHLKYVTTDPLFMVSMNVKSDGIYNYANKVDLLKHVVKELPDSISAEDFEQLAKNFNGDLTFVLSSIKQEAVSSELAESNGEESSYKEPKPEFMFFADITDSANTFAVLKKLFFNNNEGSFKEVSTNIFYIDRDKVYFGMHNNTLFATNMESVYANLSSTTLTNNYANQIKDKLFVMQGDIQVAKNVLEAEIRFAAMMGLYSEFGKYSFSTSAQDFSSEGKIELTTKNKNSLAIICEHIDKMIADLGSSLLRF